MGWVLGVFQSQKRSLMLTLLKSLATPTRVLLPALESTVSRRHKSYQSYSTIHTYIQNHWSTAHKLLGKTVQTQIVLSTETPWTLYNYLYLEKTQHMGPNIDGTIGHKIKTRKHLRHGTQCVIQHPTNRNPAQFLQENAITVLGSRLCNSLPKYLRHRKC